MVFENALQREEVGELVASFDVALIPLAAEQPGRMPAKVYETLASGVPMIVCEGCEAAPLVTVHGLGRVVRPSDVDALADAIVDLLDDPTEREGIRAKAREMSKRYDLDEVARGAEAKLVALAEDLPYGVLGTY